MQASLDKLIRYCAVELPECPHPLILSALNDAAIRLSRESACWNTWESVVLQSGVGEYDLSPPSSATAAFTVRKAMFNGKEFKPYPSDRLSTITPQMFAQTGTPTAYFFTGVNSIRVLPTPSDTDAGREIEFRVSWTPTLDSTTFDSDLMMRYSEALVVGAKAKLMRMPGVAWGNPQLSAYYEQQQQIEVGKARIDQLNDMTVGSLSITPRSFGRVV